MKRIVFDLDNTITIESSCGYEEAEPNSAIINKMLEYKELGFEIVISTSRNMRTYDSNLGKINKFTLPVIIEWLHKNNVPFDELYVAKPWCGTEGFYVDDRAIRPNEFLSLNYSEIKKTLRDKK